LLGVPVGFFDGFDDAGFGIVVSFHEGNFALPVRA